MTVHESSVNFQNLIRDLAEMYPFEVAEVVLIELVANSLDAGANHISIDFDPRKKLLVVKDDGRGMNASEFEDYHDFAAGLKARGTGIGFAGLGAKISFNVADKVVTETRSKSFSQSSNWYLQSKKKLLWEDIKLAHLRRCGTRVEVRFRQDTHPPYSSTKDLITLLRRHYLPLMDPKFLALYERMGFYSKDLRFVVNGQTIKPTEVRADFGLTNVKEFCPKRGRELYGYGIFGIAAIDYPVAPDVSGILLCTHGKIIKPDFFNQFPGSLGPRLLGVVEIPDFVKFLTTAKTDFICKGKHRAFERLYDPIRREFKAWLKDIGVQSMEVVATDEAARLERELKKIVEDIPELSEFFGFRARREVLLPGTNGSTHANYQEGKGRTFPDGQGIRGKDDGPDGPGDEPGEALVKDDENGLIKAKSISRVGPRGPKIGFVKAPDRVDLAWVDGNNVAINSAHPAYTKTRSNATARRFFSLFAVASAIQRFLGSGDDSPDLMFVDRMMAAWGKK